MKKLVYAILSGLALSASAAMADTTIQLDNINTNNCNSARQEILLLSGQYAMVNATCGEYRPGGYRSNDGRAYDYRLYTSVTVPGYLAPGQSVQLNYINTNNCARAQALISLLSTRNVRVDATCSEYYPGGYKSDNGRYYDYRLYTTVTVLN